MTERSRFRARWIFPVDGAPLANGTIEIEDGRIVAVHEGHDPRAEGLGNVALVPALVNSHTHLEFSDLDAPVGPARPFTAWIRSLVTARRGRSGNPAAAVSRGLTECRESGTGLVGEIATAPWRPEPAPDRAPAVVVFRELLGLPAERTEGQLALAREQLDSFRTAPAGTYAGLSPHAPYSVHPQLFLKLVELAAERRVPVAMHLAETEAELELLDRGTGEFVDLLRGFGAWDPGAIPPGSRPLDYLRPLAGLERGLVIHGNYLAPDEIDFLAAHPQLTTVYCPRTHAYFGHAPHPWKQMLARGIRVAVGTDSRGSNPDLNLWREVQFLHALAPEIDPAALLRMATLSGAESLGFSAELGSLTPGKRAAIIAVRLPDGAEGDPHELLLAGDVTSWSAGGNASS